MGGREGLGVVNAGSVGVGIGVGSKGGRLGDGTGNIGVGTGGKLGVGSTGGRLGDGSKLVEAWCSDARAGSEATRPSDEQPAPVSKKAASHTRLAFARPRPPAEPVILLCACGATLLQKGACKSMT